MIYSLRGTLIHSGPSHAVVECGGVGYLCKATANTLASLPETGKEVFLYTYLNIREDAVDLFGFSSQAELSSFQMLIGVSGVGPKVALAILSSLPPDRFALAVATSDFKSIMAAPGVGKKLAERIVLELKDKITPENLKGGGLNGEQIQRALPQGGAGEAISALVVLGYTQGEAAAAISGLDPDLPVEELIKKALRALGSRR